MKYLLYAILFINLLACQSTTTNQATVDQKEEVNPIKETTLPTSRSIAPPKTTSYDQTTNDYRNENWRPEEGNYLFTQAWTFNYLNEEIPPADDRHKGTFTVYVDPPTGTMLLTKADAKYRDEMTDYIIIHPDGRYTTAFTDVHGKPNIVEQNMVDFNDYAYRLGLQEEEFQKYFTKQKGSKVFGANKYGWPTMKGTPYIQFFAGTTDTAHLHVVEIPFSMQGLYLVRETNPDLQFPINLNFGYVLPENYMVLDEIYIYDGRQISFELVSVSPAEYFVNTVSYGVNH